MCTKTFERGIKFAGEGGTNPNFQNISSFMSCHFSAGEEEGVNGSSNHKGVGQILVAMGASVSLSPYAHVCLQAFDRLLLPDGQQYEVVLHLVLAAPQSAELKLLDIVAVLFLCVVLEPLHVGKEESGKKISFAVTALAVRHNVNVFILSLSHCQL